MHPDSYKVLIVDDMRDDDDSVLTETRHAVDQGNDAIALSHEYYADLSRQMAATIEQIAESRQRIAETNRRLKRSEQAPAMVAQQSKPRGAGGAGCPRGAWEGGMTGNRRERSRGQQARAEKP